MTSVAVLGAGGTMGSGMSLNLLEIGFEVRAWNRSADKLGPVLEEGATACETPAEAARGADVILTILSDAEAVSEVMEAPDGALEDAAEGVVWVQASTIGIAGIEHCAGLARRSGAALYDAPVLGTKKPAEDGQLVVLAAGPEDGRDTVEPIFDAIGKRTIWVGAAPGQGTRLKVAVNSWIVSVTEGTAESLALAEAMGLDPKLVLDAVEDGPLDLPYMRTKGTAMIKREFTPSFRLALAAKDARLSVDAANSVGIELPMLEAIADRMTEAAEEHGDHDMAATFLASAPGA
jgi:3-hydroxyisobutyrate dehydrogenase